jgi:hypothetical protein
MFKHNLHSIAFPVLDEHQLNQLENCAVGALKQCRSGQTLVTAGDGDRPWMPAR